MGFYHDHYYIQAQYANDYIFSKCLKSEIGGLKTKDMWYEYPKASYNFSKGEFIDGFKSSTELQKEIISRVDYLLDVIEKNYRITQCQDSLFLCLALVNFGMRISEWGQRNNLYGYDA